MQYYQPTIIDALHSLGFDDVSGVIPSSEEEYGNLNIYSDNTPPTWDEVNSKLVELQATYDAQDYARNRKAEYDQLNQFEMQFDDDRDSTTTWVDAINEIKGRHPK